MDENQAAKKPMTKTEIFTALSEATGLTKDQVGSLFDELAKLIGKNLGVDGPGTFAIPGLLQIKVVRKPATEEHKGINPFTKEEMIVKAKPATNAVKVVALKGLKELVKGTADRQGKTRRWRVTDDKRSHKIGFVAHGLLNQNAKVARSCNKNDKPDPHPRIGRQRSSTGRRAARHVTRPDTDRVQRRQAASLGALPGCRIDRTNSPDGPL